MECDICCITQYNFFKLQCCNNQMCRDCLDLLVNSRCPFCRREIPELQNRVPRSLPNAAQTIESPLFFLYDDIFTESRIYRKYLKRMRKLEQRERDREQNKNLSQAYKNSKASHRAEIQNQINEETMIFQIDLK